MGPPRTVLDASKISLRALCAGFYEKSLHPFTEMNGSWSEESHSEEDLIKGSPWRREIHISQTEKKRHRWRVKGRELALCVDGFACRDFPTSAISIHSSYQTCIRDYPKEIIRVVTVCRRSYLPHRRRFHLRLHPCLNGFFFLTALHPQILSGCTADDVNIRTNLSRLWMQH